MKVTVLGGSAAGGNTGAGCSGYLVETTSAEVVLDLGPGTLHELRRHTDFRSLSGIVISHMHLDHILDLAALRFALAYNPVKPSKRLLVWLPPGGTALMTRLALAFADEDDEETFFTSVYNLREFTPERGVQIDDLAIAFAPTIHYIPCWAMRLDAPGQGRLGYTADTGPAAPLAPFLSSVDVLIAEATLAEPDDAPFDQRGHLTAQEAGELARNVVAKTLILSHIWEEIGFAQQSAAAKSEFSGRVVLASPGVAVEW